MPGVSSSWRIAAPAWAAAREAMSTQRTSRGNPLDRLGQSMARSFFERAQGARAKRLERSPTARVLLSFGLLILCGTFLLWLPACAAAGQPGLSFVDALFTSTSAVCVTGLSTIDVGLRLSGLGQECCCC